MKELIIGKEYNIIARCGSDEISFKSDSVCSMIEALINGGYLPKNILVGTNSELVKKYEDYDYTVITYFNVKSVSDVCELHFERIDTYAEIYVNDKFVSKTDNGLISYVFNVSSYVVKGKNKLTVKLFAPVKNRKRSNTDKGAFSTDRIGTRRVQCTYGWDWVDRFVTCGFYGVKLLIYSNNEAVVDNIQIKTPNINEDYATVKIVTALKNRCKKRLTFKISNGEKEVAESSKFVSENDNEIITYIKQPKLWYPLGYGNQALYTLSVLDNDKEIYREEFGIRTIEIFEGEDGEGSDNYDRCLKIKNTYSKDNCFASFILLVNGKKIFCKGGNWVPCFPYNRKDYNGKMKEVLKLAVKSGVNMIRVWGGGQFESKEFYDECSRLGIMVIQDFLMVCGDYPETKKWFIDSLKKETEYLVKLVRNEPCIMWFHGDNENAVEGCDTVEDYKGKKSFYNGIYIVAKDLDDRRFLPSSPYGGNQYGSNTKGTTHNTNFLWDIFCYSEKEDIGDYKEFIKTLRARFISEEGQFGATSYSSLSRFMTENEIFGDKDDMWLYHTKTNPYVPKHLFYYMENFSKKIFGDFCSNKDRLFKNEYIQYEWVRLTLEQARREQWFCSGIIYWMLNDCWTASSGWSLIDYYNKPKLAYYSFKNCAKAVICSIDREDGCFNLYVSNIGVEDHNVKAKLFLLKGSGKKLIKSYDIFSKANVNYCFDKISLETEDGILVLDYTIKGNGYKCFYKNGSLPLLKDSQAISYKINGDNTITVTANKNVLCVYFGGDYIYSDNGFMMLKDEEKTISFEKTTDGKSLEIYCDTYCVKN